MVDPFAEEARGTPFQEPGVDGHSSHETPVQDQPRVEVHSAHETTVPEASPDVERPGWDTWPDRTELPNWTEGPGGSGGGDGGDELTDSEGHVQVDGATVYKRGSTCLLAAPATRAQRPMIKPEGDRYVHLLFFILQGVGTPSWSPQAELRPWCALPDRFPGVCHVAC